MRTSCTFLVLSVLTTLVVTATARADDAQQGSAPEQQGSAPGQQGSAPAQQGPAPGQQGPGPVQPAPVLRAAQFLRTIRAARRTGPIKLDGTPDEPAWQAAEEGHAFTQAAPEEGKPASVSTRFHVLWDDEAIWFSAECDDPEPVTANLSRRDRFVEGDWISFDLDTTYDRRTAYHFQVFAAGHQLDALHFNDTDFTSDWDAAWESAVAQTAKGWSVEMRIPLRSLRIPDGALKFGFNVYRGLSRLHEEDQWRFRPRDTPGDVSVLGILEGIAGIRPVRELELRPYIGARAVRTTPAPANTSAPGLLAPCSSIGLNHTMLSAGCVGLDVRYNLASDLLLVATLNPDFGQVEADARVLNLSTFETFFPEKRPFFLEGLDLFKPPLRADFGGPYGGDAYQVFYSRRIGRNVATPDLLEGQSLIYQPASQAVLSAIKLAGTIGRASVGLLSAVEPRLDAQLRQDGRNLDQRVAEANNSVALRVRAPLGEHALLGVVGTEVDPLFAAPSLQLGLEQRHAHVGGADLAIFDSERDWNFTAQAVGSVLNNEVADVLRDGTIVGGTRSGYAASAKVSRDGGALQGELQADYLSPLFDTNDLGFMPRANLFRTFGLIALRDVHPNSWRQTARVLVAAREVRDARQGLLLERDLGSEFYINLNSQWNFGGGIYGNWPNVDDRELGDGTPLARQAGGFAYGFVNSDSRKPVSFGMFYLYGIGVPLHERQFNVNPGLVLRPLPQLEATIDFNFQYNTGTIRQIREATALPVAGQDPTLLLDKRTATDNVRLYLLAPQDARAISSTIRATYAFTPRLTLQAYAQIFTAGVAYGDPLRAVVGPGRRTVTLDELLPAKAEDKAPTDVDDRQAGININLILRWEWRTGSTFYLVYAHAGSADFVPSGRGLSFSGELDALHKGAITRGDTLLVKVDLLHAL